MKYIMKATSQSGECLVYDKNIEFTAGVDSENAFFELNIEFPEWEEDTYVMMPACVYNGNRYKRIKRNSYPPMYQLDEVGVNCEPLMTDLPALNPDGSGEIQVTAGDMSVPCVGIFYRKKKQGFLIFTKQEIKGKNLGFTLSAGKLEISYPKNRNLIYRFCKDNEQAVENGIQVTAGEKLESDYIIFNFDCENILEFFRVFFENRKCIMSDERPGNGYTDELWNIMEKHFNEHNWSGEYYSGCTQVWGCGWAGGGMAPYGLMQLGNDETKRRAEATMDYMVKNQADSGFYYSVIENGRIMDDSTSVKGLEGLHLLRRSADGLYFLMKMFDITKPKESWIRSAQKCADAFVELYKKYNMFGQYINIDTGDIVAGGTTSAACAVAALAKAGVYFENQEYIDIAKAALDDYYYNFICNGVTLGGPGDIISAPDSESAFELVESCIALYEATNEEKFIKYAKACTEQAASWVVTYKYKYPVECEFKRLDINTVGAVFANVQNKHAAPGIATISGDCIYKLYKYTKDTRYLELIKDIAYFMPQCVSSESRPIYSWDVPPQKLPEGYINERVNMSDWEGESHIGGVFGLSCWCDTSLVLSFAELACYEDFMN